MFLVSDRLGFVLLVDCNPQVVGTQQQIPAGAGWLIITSLIEVDFCFSFRASARRLVREVEAMIFWSRQVHDSIWLQACWAASKMDADVQPNRSGPHHLFLKWLVTGISSSSRMLLSTCIKRDSPLWISDTCSHVLGQVGWVPVERVQGYGSAKLRFCVLDHFRYFRYWLFAGMLRPTTIKSTVFPGTRKAAMWAVATRNYEKLYI